MIFSCLTVTDRVDQGDKSETTLRRILQPIDRDRCESRLVAITYTEVKMPKR